MKLNSEFVCYAVAILIAFYVLDAPLGHANAGEEFTRPAADTVSTWMPLIIAEGVWLLLVGVIAPAYAAFTNSEETERRGLNLPRGSVRSLLALLIIGSFVIVLVFGPMTNMDLDAVIAAFATLAGSVLGFYFGSRTATPTPEESNS